MGISSSPSAGDGRLARLLVLLTLLGIAVGAMAKVAISYTLPTTGPLPKTYSVTLAITDSSNTDWIISTCLAAQPRTVTAANNGAFTDYWDGLDENGMPVPPGTYKVKGVYLPASTWAADGQAHGLPLDYVTQVGDSWGPAKGDGMKFPHVSGFGFSNMEDIQVASNGKAGFTAGSNEAGFTPYFVDMTKAVGWDQVISKCNTDGIVGAQIVACDGDYVWAASHWDQPYIYRSTDKNVWGPDSFGWGMLKGRALGAGTNVPSMVGWKRTSDSAHFLYVALEDTTANTGTVKTYDGGATAATLLGTSPAVSYLTAVTYDKTNPGNRLYALYQVSGSWKVGYIALSNGVPTGSWTTLFTLSGISNPTDLDMDVAGYFYIASEWSHAVYRVNSSGTIVRTYGGSAQTAGSYDANKFMYPRHISVWRDSSNNDLLVVNELGGPNRISEWRTDGTRTRQWFFMQQGDQFGGAVDPADPTKIYTYAANDPSGAGLVRWDVDYTNGTWTVGAIYPNICNAGNTFPTGTAYPRIWTVNGQKYLCFAGAYVNGNKYMIYRLSGANWVPSAGIYNNGTSDYWWHDANGDGLVQATEYNTTAAVMPSKEYWGDVFTSDLTLMCNYLSQNSANGFGAGTSLKRNTPSSFDAYNNPVFTDSGWTEVCIDTVARNAQAGTAGPTVGGNEWGDVMNVGYDADGSAAGGYYVAGTGGKWNLNPYSPYAHHDGLAKWTGLKLTRFNANGSIKWRVGRAALTYADKGEMYEAQHVTGPVNNLVAVASKTGQVYFYAADSGLYLDTMMLDSAVIPWESRTSGGMFLPNVGTWMHPQLVSYNSKTYLIWGRNAQNIYEITGWTSTAPQTVTGLPATVTLTPANLDSSNLYALKLQGDYGTAKTWKATPAPQVAPALDGTLTGWETCAVPVKYQADANRTVTVHTVNDADNLYLRIHLRTGVTLALKTMPADATTLFTDTVAADTVSLYLRTNTASTTLSADGVSGDVRFVFGPFNVSGTPTPKCLGMYPNWPFGGSPTAKSYTGASGTVNFAHVGLMTAVQMGYRADPDNMGWVIAAKIPRANVIPNFSSLAFASTIANFDANFFSGGTKTRAWWANLGKVTTGITTTNDVAAEARFYPASWTQAVLSGGLTPPPTGLLAWLKPETLSTLSEGQHVSNWADSSGNGNIFSHTDLNNQPTYSSTCVNGWPAVRFNGSQDQLYSMVNSYSGPAQAFAYGQALNGQPDGNRVAFSAVSNDTLGFTFGSGAGIALPGVMEFVPATPWKQRSFQQLGLGQWWNGVTGGATNTTANAWKGDISEVLVYGTDADAATSQRVRDYLHAKYDELPNVTPPPAIPQNGITMWLKADAITGLSDGAAVSTWADSSGSNNNMTQATAGYKPIYKTSGLRGKPSVRFDGTDDNLLANYTMPTTELTIVTVFATLNSDANGSIITAGNNPWGTDPVFNWLWDYDRTIQVKNGKLQAWVNGYPNGNFYTYGSAVVNNNNYHTAVLSLGAAGEKLYTDGAFEDQNASITNAVNPASMISVVMGYNPDGGCLNGDISEVIVYNRQLTTYERKQLISYLDTKYNGTGNTFPTVSLTAPTDGSSSAAPASITLSATASDAGGSISKVEFYKGTTLIATDSTSPYSYSWTSVPAGRYAITARAYDNNSAVSISATSTVSVTGTNSANPTCSISSPSNNATFSTGANVTINATASDSDGINRVQFFQGSTRLGEDTSSPYSYTWSSVPNGTYALTAKAYDALGAVTTSSTVNITVGGTSSTIDVPWDVVTSNITLLSYTPGQGSGIQKTSGTSVWGEAWAYCTSKRITGNGSVSCKVPANNVGRRISLSRVVTNSDSTNTDYCLQAAGDAYVYVVENGLTPGTAWTTYAANDTITIDRTGTTVTYKKNGVTFYTSLVSSTGDLFVQASFNHLNGSFTECKATGTSANASPTSSITSPTDNSSYAAPASITINASASDSDGTISKVEFYNGTTLLGTDTSSPYSYTWTNVSGGSYALTSKAYDNGGAATASSEVNVSVSASSGPWAQYLRTDTTTQGSMWSSGGGYVYGSKGYNLINWNNVATENLTGSYVSSLSFSGNSPWCWAGAPSADVRALMNPATSTRSIGVFYSTTTMDTTITLANANDGITHQVALYCIDWDSYGRTQTVDVLNASTGTTLLASPVSLSSYSAGKWLVFNFKGNIKIRCTYTGPVGGNAVFSAIAFDDVANAAPTCNLTAPANNATFTAPATVTMTATATDSDGTISKVEFYQGATKLGEDTSSPYSFEWANVAAGNYALTAKAYDNNNAATTSSTVNISVSGGTAPWAQYVRTDTTTQGSMWSQGGGYVYGSNGYNLINWNNVATQNLTGSYVSSLSFSGTNPWCWAGAPSSDVRALTNPATNTRSCGVFYTATTMDTTVTLVNPTDGVTRQVAIYCVDWDNLNRVQTVDVLNASTGTSLLSAPITVSSFGSGKWIVFNFKNNIKIRITYVSGSSANAVFSAIAFDN